VHFNRQGLGLGARLGEPGGQGLGAHAFELDRDKLTLQAELHSRTRRGAEVLQRAYGLVSRHRLTALQGLGLALQGLHLAGFLRHFCAKRWGLAQGVPGGRDGHDPKNRQAQQQAEQQQAALFAR
jgi:hypothetical protein